MSFVPTPSIHRIRFFENQVHMDAWKNSMAGENEAPVIKILDAIGYANGVDYVRQHPVGEKFVIDFAFVNEQVALEVDGKSHKAKRQMALDKKRDRYLFANNWVSIRIKDEELFGYKMSFYKNLIKQVVKERREQYVLGTLYPLDFTTFYDQDYE